MSRHAMREALIREQEAESLVRHKRTHAAKPAAGSKSPVEVRGVRELAYAEIHRRAPNGRPALWRPGIVARALAAILAAILTAVTAMTCAALYGAALLAGITYAATHWF